MGASTTDFAAPTDPHDLTFDPPPVPDSPVFLEPTSAASVPSAPSNQPFWNPEGTPLPPPTLVEPPGPDGLADLWRAASESETSEVGESAPTPVETPAPDTAPAPLSADPSPAPPSAVASGFDDLLTGSADAPDPQPPSSAWVAGEPNPTEPATDAATGDRRPFGEGVERDEAVDPSDSIFGVLPAPVSVNTAGVAVVPENISIGSQPIRVLAPAEPDEPVTFIAPPIVPSEPVGLEPTPAEQRVGRAARLFWLWFAANSSIAAIVFGAIIFALGVSLRQAIVATLAGVAISFLPLGLGTLVGKQSGQPTMVISRATFGVVGNILPSLIALFSRLFWAAALLWVLGAGTAEILTGARLTDGFTTGQLTIIAMGIGFVLAVVLAYFGYGLIAKVQLVISVISGIAIVGFIALTYQHVNFTTAVSTPDGPWILVVSGAVLVFSFVGLAWANSSSDVARYQRPGSSGAASVLWASFGVALPSFVLISYGALLAGSNATLAEKIATDPLDALARLLPGWYPGPLLAATVLSLLSGIVLALYSSGFALQAAGLRLRRSLSTLVAGVLMLLIAIILTNALIDFGQLFRDIATTVAVPVAAWAGIFGAEIMIRKRRFDSHSLLNRGGVYADARWGNLITLVAVSVIGYGFLSATMPALTWEGYLFSALGVPINGELAASDLGVLVALALGLLVPLLIGRSGIRAQEKATRVPE
jgi:purine-cytosine permease-like protein